MAYNFPPVNKIFDDLDKFRDYCRFEGKVFNEKDLYKEGTRLGMPIKNGKVGCELKLATEVKTLCNDHVKSLIGVIK
jgi:hypothetical protein